MESLGVTMSVFNSKHNAIFIHIPRTGGTSMERREFLGWGGHETVRDFRDKEGFDDAFKFAFVRNPWDRYVSAWSLLNEGQFFDVRITSPRIHFRPQHEFICDEDGNVLVDFVGRYETLKADWRYVCDKLGVPPHLAHHRPGDHQPYREYYTPETWAALAELYATDIELFGYGTQYGGST